MVLIFFLGIIAHNSFNEINNWSNKSYNTYMTDISKYIDTDEKVFASINTSFFMHYKQLASYNDLEMFKKSGINF